MEHVRSFAVLLARYNEKNEVEQVFGSPKGRSDKPDKLRFEVLFVPDKAFRSCIVIRGRVKREVDEDNDDQQDMLNFAMAEFTQLLTDLSETLSWNILTSPCRRMIGFFLLARSEEESRLARLYTIC